MTPDQYHHLELQLAGCFTIVILHISVGWMLITVEIRKLAQRVNSGGDHD